jgi:hypothetical protein
MVYRRSFVRDRKTFISREEGRKEKGNDREDFVVKFSTRLDSDSTHPILRRSCLLSRGIFKRYRAYTVTHLNLAFIVDEGSKEGSIYTKALYLWTFYYNS